MRSVQKQCLKVLSVCHGLSLHVGPGAVDAEGVSQRGEQSLEQGAISGRRGASGPSVIESSPSLVCAETPLPRPWPLGRVLVSSGPPCAAQTPSISTADL